MIPSRPQRESAGGRSVDQRSTRRKTQTAEERFARVLVTLLIRSMRWESSLTSGSFRVAGCREEAGTWGRDPADQRQLSPPTSPCGVAASSYCRSATRPLRLCMRLGETDEPPDLRGRPPEADQLNPDGADHRRTPGFSLRGQGVQDDGRRVEGSTPSDKLEMSRVRVPALADIDRNVTWNRWVESGRSPAGMTCPRRRADIGSVADARWRLVPTGSNLQVFCRRRSHARPVG